jgi:hypothetical protein
MSTNNSKIFLEWLTNRLIYKHHEDDAETIENITNIVQNKYIIDKNIDLLVVEKICRKYHADWDFEESELNFGHSDESRNGIRSYTQNIIKDYINEICSIG